MKIWSRLYAIYALLLLSAFAVTAQTRGDVYALTNARIVTVSGATIEKGTIVVRDGLIEAVGADAKAPADAKVIDASGLTVYPGFIDALTNVGLPAPAAPAGQQRGGGGGGFQVPQPAAATTNSNYPPGMQPETDVVEALRGGDTLFETNRNAGFTTVLTVGRDGLFNGQSAVINLAGEKVSDLVIKSSYAQHFTFRTVPGQYPGSLLGTFSAFRQMLLDAKRLQEWQKAYAANPKGMKRPDSDRSLEALFPVINGTMPIVFNAGTEREINRALDLAKEFNLKAMIGGGQEAWKVASRLKSQNVGVLLSLNFPKRTSAASPDADPEDLDTLRLRAETPKGPGKLDKAGVKFAFQSGGLTNLADFFTNAAKARDGGLSADATLRAMTLGAAQILGVDDRLGSIEAGKIANLTVVRGDILGTEKTITHVFVDGRMFEQKERPRTERGPGAGRREGPNGPNAPSVPNFSGTYSIMMEIPGQPMSATIAVTQEGSAVTGTFSSQTSGGVPLKNGKATADGFSFDATVQFQGQSLDLVVTGKVSGTQINGTIQTPMGAVPFSGTKNP